MLFRKNVLLVIVRSKKNILRVSIRYFDFDWISYLQPSMPSAM